MWGLLRVHLTYQWANVSLPCFKHKHGPQRLSTGCGEPAMSGVNGETEGWAARLGAACTPIFNCKEDDSAVTSQAARGCSNTVCVALSRRPFHSRAH